ncbi:caspase, EACC1-associated type [Streptomyces siamensis]|uniref:caspase, EACC1-associated type n=1 Tax=Streptomyces siamensis TaxID=1274986 RepID=UPI0031E6DDA2
MPGGRHALLIATGRYDHPELRRLRSPAQDAQGLAKVLRDPRIGDFDVRTVVDRRHHEVNRDIEEFFLDRSRDDLLLLHLSCHGIKNDNGELFFAAKDTDPKLLASTAVTAEFLHTQMRRSRARSIVLLLDCCYSGAFLPGSKGDTSVHVKDELAGHGRAVLTATNRTEYAWEGGHLGELAPEPSRFTGAVIEGLRTGEADGNRDGLVSVKDLYEYVYERLHAERARQRPQMWAELEYRVVVAYAGRAPAPPAGGGSPARGRGAVPSAAVRPLSMAHPVRGAKPAGTSVTPPPPKADSRRGAERTEKDREGADASPAAPSPAAASPWRTFSYGLPVLAPILIPYRAVGSMWAVGYNTGVDFAVPSGTRVRAVTAGHVVAAGWAGSFGYEVVVRHADGHYSQYAHLSSLMKRAGQDVLSGEVIGRSGSTGNCAGPRLHFEVRTGPGFGTDIDPLAHLAERGVDVARAPAPDDQPAPPPSAQDHRTGAVAAARAEGPWGSSELHEPAEGRVDLGGGEGPTAPRDPSS